MGLLDTLVARVNRLEQVKVDIARLKAEEEELERVLIPEEVYKLTTDGDWNGVPAIGKPQIPLPDGRVVTVQKQFSVDVTKADQALLFEHLRESGEYHLIKTFLTFNCGNGGRFPAGAIVRLAREQLGYPFDYEMRESVHGTVLKNWAHARRNAGIPIPDFVKVWEPDVTTITPAETPAPEVPKVAGSQEHPTFDGPISKADTLRVAQNWDKIGDPYGAQKSSLSPGADGR